VRLEAQPASRLDRLFVALADGNRRAMIDQLSGGPASMSDLARPLGIALPSALKHLAVLEGSGVVRSEKVGRTRTYHMAPDAFSGLEAWVSARKAQWNSQLDRLERFLEGDRT
jgi:DNA-binding transcriptional ArsR family regulator